MRWDITTQPAGDGLHALLDEGWEPYGYEPYGLHYLRRFRGPVRGAVVIQYSSRPQAQMLKALLCGWDVVKPMTSLAGRQWPRIIMLWRPRKDAGWRWIREDLRHRLSNPNRGIEWLIE